MSRKSISFLLLLLLSCLPAMAQPGNSGLVTKVLGKGAPIGGCGTFLIYSDQNNGDLYNCWLGGWAKVTGTGTGGGNGVWGQITGTLSNQTDLQTSLNALAPISNPSFLGTVGGTFQAPSTDQSLLFNQGGIITGDGQLLYNYSTKQIIWPSAFVVTSAWPGAPLSPPGANLTRFGPDVDGTLKVCVGTGACQPPAGLTSFPDGTTTAPGFPATNHPELGLAVVLSKIAYTITNVARTSNVVTITVSTPQVGLNWPAGAGTVSVFGLTTPYDVLNCANCALTGVSGGTPTSTFTYTLAGTDVVSAAASGSASIYDAQITGYSIEMTRFVTTSNNPARRGSIRFAHLDAAEMRNNSNSDDCWLIGGVTGVDETQVGGQCSGYVGTYLPGAWRGTVQAAPANPTSASDFRVYVDSTSGVLTCLKGNTGINCMPPAPAGGSPGQVQFNSGGSLQGSAAITFGTAGQNTTWSQVANGDDMIYGKRNTDTTPTGNFIHFQSAAAADLFTVGIDGSITVPQGGSATPSINFSGGSMHIYASSAAQMTVVAGTVNNFTFLSNTLQTLSTGKFGWTSVSNSTGSIDTALCRAAANIVEISTSTTCNNSGGLQLSSLSLGAKLVMSVTAPTITSGFGTTPSVVNNNGTAAFTINVGTGGTATSGVVGLPAATTGWACFATDLTTPGPNFTKQSATSTTSATLTNYNSSGVATAWTASDVVQVSCNAY